MGLHTVRQFVADAALFPRLCGGKTRRGNLALAQQCKIRGEESFIVVDGVSKERHGGFERGHHLGRIWMWPHPKHAEDRTAGGHLRKTLFV